VLGRTIFAAAGETYNIDGMKDDHLVSPQNWIKSSDKNGRLPRWREAYQMILRHA